MTLSDELHAFDRLHFEHGNTYIAGIDEAGRGPLAGPVVASAVVLKYDTLLEGVNDSKKLSENRRSALFWDILCESADIGVGIVPAGEIDRVNILNATRSAMIRAFEDLRIQPDILLIDALKLPSLPVRQHSIIKGDARSAGIGAASIVA